MLKNAELSYCKDCVECSSAVLDEVLMPKCGSCGSYHLIDMSDGSKFVAVFEEEEE